MRIVRLFALLLFAGVAAAGENDVPLQGATLSIRWQAQNLRELGLHTRAMQPTYSLLPDADLRLVLHEGQSSALRGGGFRVAGRWDLSIRGRHVAIDASTLAVARAETFELALHDAQQREWLRFDHAHPQTRVSGVAAEWRHFDVRIGLELAQRLGDPRLAGLPLGSATLNARLAVQAKAVSSCVAPNFPNTGPYTIDVALTAIDSADATCNGSCTGNGAANALVKLTPSAMLQGVGTGDAPWYQKFATSPHNYPYPGNDQHPFLVWSVYRINASGQIEQLARSGVKHAFFSTNAHPSGAGGCGCGPANVLWAGCTDTYGWSTNDEAAWLAPRAEIIPVSGQWGRCGSLRDLDCNGVDDQPQIADFDLRAVVREAQIVPALNPGAQWFLEAWYVVRDDVNVINSFGHRRILPTWSAATSKWILGFADPPNGPWLPFATGPVIERWMAPGTTTPTTMSRDAVSADGRVRLAVKVTALAGARYRYDYALMNFDHSRAETSGNEPNLRVLSNAGPIAFALPLSQFAAPVAEMHDGDRDPNNDWAAIAAPSGWRFEAPPGSSMPWGALYRFSMTIDLPPVASTATVTPGGSGSPLPLSVDTLVPDSSLLPILFANGFE